MVQNRFPIRVVTWVLFSLFAHPGAAISFSESLAAYDPFFSFNPPSEAAVQTFRPLVPPEQAAAMGLGSTVKLELRLRDEKGNLLFTESGEIPTLSVPRGGFGSILFSATGCLVDGDVCDLVVELPDGTSQVFPEYKRERKFGRVIVIPSVACATKPCGPGVSGQIAVIDSSTGDTRSLSSINWILNQDFGSD
jgi:hypothetical protein